MSNDHDTEASADRFSFPPEEKKKNPTQFKLVTILPDEKIVGLHILGDGVGEMTQGFGVAVKMGATKKDFDSTVAIHPVCVLRFLYLLVASLTNSCRRVQKNWLL